MRRTPLRAALLLALFAASASGQSAGRPFLFKDARAEVAAARARGEKEVTLVIAAVTGANAKLAKTIVAMGGSIRFREDDVDYLRARVPVDSVEKIARDPNLFSLDVSKKYQPQANGASTDETNAATAAAARAPKGDSTKRVWPPLMSDYPLTHPFSPLGDLGAAEFRKAHPTYDGRGVTIALIDMNLDALLPELQVATTLDGKPTQKIVVYETALDPLDEDDGRWLTMTDSVTAAAGKFSYKGSTYTAPRAGTFRIALFDEARFDSLSRSGIDKDINRDGNPPGSSRLFAVLWDQKTNDVWVDTNQDLKFTDETALTDFSARPVFGVFGKDNPKTPVRESVSFAIQIDKAKQMIAINAGVASHASLIVGSVAASKGTRGRFDGVAPGVRLANVSEGGAAYGQTEAVIRALKNPLIDAAWTEQSSNISGPYLLRDGRLVPTIIYSRLIAKYNKPLMIPTHNYGLFNAVDDYVMAKGAIGIGGHEGRDNFFINHGVRVEHADNLLVTGGYGPMGDGSFGPQVLSPSNVLSTNRGFLPGGVMAGLYRLPPGYANAGGTSTATPVSTGAVAMLISAARQSGVKVDPYRLKYAITMSARYVPHIEAYKQGNGVINVGAAWEILKKLDTMKVFDLGITSRAPVHHSYSQLLPTPNEGPGLFEREGWAAGSRGERTMTFTRSAGPKEPMTFTLSFTGDSAGTFSAPKSVTLPLGTPVPVTITVAPKTAGAHSAVLTLDNPSLPAHAYRTLATIVAAEPLNEANKYTVERKSAVMRPAMKNFFYQVPEGTTALKVDLAAMKRDVAVTVVRPDTRTATAVRTAGSAAGRGGGGGGGGADSTNRATYVVDDPMPGVWEIRLSDVNDTRTFDFEQAEKPEPVPPTQVTLTVSAIGLTVAAPPQSQDASSASTASPNELTITNRMAEFTGGIASLPLGSARRQRPVIHDKEQQVFEIDVPPGSTTLSVRARALDAGTDVDVYLFNCSARECRNAGFDSNPIVGEAVTVQNPAAGKWKVVVDAPSVPSGSATYEYLDVVFNPSFGMVSVADRPDARKLGAQWTVRSNTWAAGQLPEGRMPFAAVQVLGQPRGAERLALNLLEIGSSVGAVGQGAPRK
ncbi:MAG: hypothetical protein ACHQQ3_10030 [Gemmatimonadales bacterium]